MSGQQTDYSAAFRTALEDLDVALMRKLWAHVQPNMPQPKTDAGTLVALHHARTQARSVEFDKRAYSHAWLVERGYPSGLPEHLKPRAHRTYPVVAKAVGISVSSRSPLMKPLVGEVRAAMERSVLESFADGRQDDTDFVKSRMMEARDRTIQSLVGSVMKRRKG